jgi:hypothetical protein
MIGIHMDDRQGTCRQSRHFQRPNGQTWWHPGKRKVLHLRLPVTYETSLQSTFDQKFRLPQKTTFFILHMFGACLCHDPQIFLIEQSQDVGFESLRSKLVSNRHSISIGFKATLTKSSLKLYHHIPIIDG